MYNSLTNDSLCIHRDHNAFARLQNSILIAGTGTLTALHNPTTNVPIANFPATPNAIQQMSAARIGHVLGALDLPTNGSTAEKKERLRLYIGLKANPA